MPDNNDAKPAMMNEMTTPGPASRFAIRPATTYMPVPLHEPTPNDTKSRVVSSFFSDNSSPRSPEPAFEMSFFLFKDKRSKFNASPSVKLDYLVHCCRSVSNFSRKPIFSAFFDFFSHSVCSMHSLKQNITPSYVEIEVVSLYENRCSFSLDEEEKDQMRSISKIEPPNVLPLCLLRNFLL